MHRIVIFVCLLLLSGAYGDFNSTNSTATEKPEGKDRSHLLLSFISPMALGISSGLIAIVAIATSVICFFDMRGQSGLSKEARTGDVLHWRAPPLPASEKKKKVSPHVSKKQNESEESSKSQKDEMKMHELEAEATQFSLIRGASSRLDAHEKHARIIEAIYQASGRDLPEMYRTKNRLNVKKPEDLDNMLNPLEAIHEEEDDVSGQESTKNKTVDTIEDAPDAPEPAKVDGLASEKPKEAGSPKKDVVSEKDSTTTKQNTEVSNKESASKDISKEDVSTKAEGKEDKKGSKEDIKEEKKGSGEGVKEEKKDDVKEEKKDDVKEDLKLSKEEIKEEIKDDKKEAPKEEKIEGLQKEDEKKEKEPVKEVKVDGLKKE